MPQSKHHLLPEYKHPPLTEVAISVQFQPIEKLSAAHMGILWHEEFREQFPQVEQHVPREPVIERFGQKPAKIRPIPFKLIDAPPVPRLWFLNELGTELVQVQQDRFVHNWRKANEEDGYPRFENLKETFVRKLNTFQQFLAKEQLGEIQPNQCELTYVNHILSNEGWERHGEVANVITLWASHKNGVVANEPEDARFATRYIITGQSGQPQGRLHITLEPAYISDDDRPIFILTLTARGAPDTTTIDSVISFLDKGHEYIVRSFTAVTSQQMHRLWERTQ